MYTSTNIRILQLIHNTTHSNIRTVPFNTEIVFFDHAETSRRWRGRGKVNKHRDTLKIYLVLSCVGIFIV